MGEREQDAIVDEASWAAARRQRRIRRFRKRVLFCAGTLLVIFVMLLFGMGLTYQGPRTLAQVTEVMPGVPIFPFSTIAPRNHGGQRALALPIMLMHLQGIAHADAVFLRTPADSDFVRDWYRRSMQAQDWQFIRQEWVGDNAQMLFLRQREGVHLLVGEGTGLITPVELLYVNGLTDRQLAQIAPGYVAPPLPSTPTVTHPVHLAPQQPGIATPPPPVVQPWRSMFKQVYPHL